MARSVGIDRAKVVEVAADLADTHGFEQLTLALVATKLQIRLPSLYNHVAGLPGLRHELALKGVRELAHLLGRAAMGKSDDAALEAIAHAYRRFAHEHPGLYAATLRAPDPQDTELNAASEELLDVVLAVLSGYGLTGPDALHAIRALRSVLHGFVALEATGGFGLPLDLDESFRRLLQGFIIGLRHAVDRNAS